MHVYKIVLTSQASHFTCPWAYANLGVKVGHPRTLLGHAGLSDCNIMLIVREIAALVFYGNAHYLRDSCGC